MNTKGHYRAEVLRICLRDAGLNKSVIQQIGCILQEQFKPENYMEISGIAYFRNNWLDLEIVHSPELLEVDNSLEKLSNGDYSGLEKLSLFANQAVDFHSEHHGENVFFDALKVYFDVAYKTFKEDPEHHFLREMDRKKMVELYKELSGFYTIVPVHEHIDKPGFLGWFHVHPRGTKPSPADINSSSNNDIPALLISALPTYLTTGLQIYLLHYGKTELLYHGSLQPAKEQ